MSRLIAAIVPAFEEEGAIADVVAGIHAFDPCIEVLVIDDASGDETAAAAAAAGALVLRLPYNVGIGGAVQTGFKAALERGAELVVRLDGDGQHDPAHLGVLLEPLLRDEADVVTGSRFVDAGVGGYRPPLARRIGITWFAWLVSTLTRRRVTDTTSGFQAFNRRAVEVFAEDYPSDYPEVEASLLIARLDLRSVEVQVAMREREHGRSSITFVRSVYYMLKVTLALLVAMARKPTLPQEATRR